MSAAVRDAAEIETVGRLNEEEGYFSPSSLTDERKRVLREIVQRRGRPEFREALLQAYGRQCAVTECNAECAIEAAHILGYLGPDTNNVANGLPLRCDIHTLFDRNMLAI
jgi:predicted restriction endonuclease